MPKRRNVIRVGKTSPVDEQTLIGAANTANRSGITPAGRAFQKHLARGRSLTGVRTGNAADNARQGDALIRKILNDPDSVYTIHTHPVYGLVLSVQPPAATGAMWTADGERFIQILEPSL